MKDSVWRERLLESTRGRVLALLQTKDRTVNELVHGLGLTDNAVRAHLIGLERDGLVRRTGREAGVRRPHIVYGVTLEAEHIFPKAYGPILNEFVTVIAPQLGPRALRASMRQVGRRIARQKRKSKKQSKADRIQAALALLKEMGGAASFSATRGKNFILGNGCPLRALTAHHPEGCLIAESLLREIIDAPVKERCSRGLQPSCRFEIS